MFTFMFLVSLHQCLCMCCNVCLFQLYEVDFCRKRFFFCSYGIWNVSWIGDLSLAIVELKSHSFFVISST
jgi:hypothetical protein